MNFTGSLVLYRSDSASFERVIDDFLANSSAAELVVVDNSPQPLQSDRFVMPRVKYRWAGRNLGFGKGHNLALSLLTNDAELHVFLNPDLSFGADVLPCVAWRFEQERDIAVLMPQVRYPDGRLQPLCKLFPTPSVLFVRRFLGRTALAERWRAEYELDGLSQEEASEVPLVSGCFLCVRGDILRALGGFDPRFFMYLEDFDLIRRASHLGRVVYDPATCVSHAYAKASYRHWRLLWHHTVSACRYFAKWGWFHDAERVRVNGRMLARLRGALQSPSSEVKS